LYQLFDLVALVFDSWPCDLFRAEELFLVNEEGKERVR